MTLPTTERMGFALLLLLVFAFSSASKPVFAVQDSTESDQTWDQEWAGTLDVQGFKLRLHLQASQNDDGDWEGHVISLDQNQAKMPLGSFELDDDQLAFTISTPPAEFRGELSDSGEEATGAWVQGGTEIDLTMRKVEGLPKAEVDSVWTGTLVVGDRELEMRVRVMQPEEGDMYVELDSLTEGINGIHGDLTIEGNEVRVVFSAVGATYEGTVSDDEMTVEGEWRQAGVSLPLNLEKSETTEIDEPDNLAIWAGTLEAGLQEIRLQFRVVEVSDDQPNARLDSLTEGLTGIPGEYSEAEDEYTFTFAQGGIEFVGSIDESGDALVGEFRQSGISIPLTLERIDAEETVVDYKPARPQMPTAPFPYEAIDVTVENSSAELELAATLTIPEGDGPFPAAVLVSGSGPQDRDETLLGHKPFLVIADYLSRRGVAVLRFDDRGVAGSTGDFDTATTADFATDASACVDFLQNHPKIAADSIGIIGHSEGGLIAPIVAADRDDLGYVVLLAGPGVNGAKIILSQSRLIAEAGGASEEDLDRQEQLLSNVIELITTTNPGDDISDQMELLLEEALSDASEEEREEAEANRDMINQQFKQFSSPWFRYFLVHEPAPVLENVDCAVLALIGEKDLQVPCDENLAAIDEALKAGGNGDYQIVPLPELNHLFQHSDTGSPTEYQSIEETFDTETLDLIAEWINSRFGS